MRPGLIRAQHFGSGFFIFLKEIVFRSSALLGLNNVSQAMQRSRSRRVSPSAVRQPAHRRELD